MRKYFLFLFIMSLLNSCGNDTQTPKSVYSKDFNQYPNGYQLSNDPNWEKM